MITKRQKQVLDFVKKSESKKGFSPSLKEIKKHFKLSAESTVHEHLKALEEKGYLQKEKNQPRGISTNITNNTLEIPILGFITAGQPLEALEVPDGTIKVPESDIKEAKKHYALRVQGNSMVDEGIFDGDIVVIKKQSVAENGQTVVAVIDDNQATLKKLYREKRKIRLQPANQKMLPIYPNTIEIRGVVVKIIRTLENKVQNNTLAYKKKTFLEEIKSSNPISKNKYKRVALSPIRYAGGKSLAVGHVLELLPENINIAFLGRGTLEKKIDELAQKNNRLSFKGFIDHGKAIISISEGVKCACAKQY